jgi:Mn-dependent DtxR family transcriptional regulator
MSFESEEDLLQAIYRLSGGQVGRVVTYSDLADRLGWDEPHVKNAARELVDSGYIRGTLGVSP